ncbi:MAG: alpha-hydroxy-acid oxidizing protein [Alphaproteobacteria bacterium]|nr:alpha-hydroxy-acid oxidizing protein [Alphaproteobacteria bacterium]
MAQTITIQDLKQQAKKNVPKMFFDYATSGSWQETTLRANRADFNKLHLRQRVGRDVSESNLNCQIFGTEYTMPLALSPIGALGMQRADGEILAAKAAKNANIPFTLSTLSICSMEQVAQATDYHPFIMQLYMIHDKTFVKKFLQRAKQANCCALMVTLDLPIMGQRYQDIRNGLTVPPNFNLKQLWQMAMRPRWMLRMAGTKNRNFGNLFGHVPNQDNLSNLALWAKEQMITGVTWQQIKWLKNEWGGKLIVKGILDEEDAAMAVDAGADAVVVSNHGGRQLDGAPSAISILPKIVAKIGNKSKQSKQNCAVHMDSGIRTGQDMLKALCLGADLCYIGRAYVYGLGANGQKGVEQTIEMIRQQLAMSLTLCGETDINKVGIHNLWEN